MSPPVAKRPRFYSKDSFGQSKFCLLEESVEDAMSIPKRYMDLCKLVKPSQSSCELPVDQLEDVFSPGSPDRWALDVIGLRPRAASDFSAYTQETTIVFPKHLN